MYKIIILFAVIALCHLTAARWPNHGHNHWGHHHDDQNSDDRDIHPPWWRRKPDNPDSSESQENNSNDFHPWKRSTESTSSTTITSTLAPPAPTERALNNDDIIRACVRACPVTSEYNPVCGSNGVTYANPGRLECAQGCGVSVQLTRKTACGIEDARNVSRSSLETCLAACPITLNFQPVCGTNNITYANPTRLQCAKSCGVAVSIDKYDPCFRWPNPELSLIKLELTACQQSCPAKVDYVPVCGTDGRTYRNTESLQCARKCGINVNIKSHNKCPENAKITDRPVTVPIITTESATREPTPITSKPVVDPKKEKHKDPNKDKKGKEPNIKEVMACMQLCPLTSEYLPICGTDGITYTNPGRLLCSQFCGIDVNVKKFAPCESASNVTFTNCNSNGGGYRPTTTVEECMRSCSTSQDNKPVCGTNDLTYKNVDQLLCAKRCGIDVCVKKQSACDNFVTPLPDTQVTPTKQPIEHDKDTATTQFTIDPDVLHSLFPDDHTKATDEFDVDERFNDKF